MVLDKIGELSETLQMRLHSLGNNDEWSKTRQMQGRHGESLMGPPSLLPQNFFSSSSLSYDQKTEKLLKRVQRRDPDRMYVGRPHS